MNLTWLEISKNAILNNISQIKKHLNSQTKFMGVVKADAYGHGLLNVASQIESEVDYLAVYDFRDALTLRRNNISKPILLLGRIFPPEIPLAIDNKIEISVSNLDLLEVAPKLDNDQKLMIHLCVETGFGRDGFVVDDLDNILKILPNKNIEVKGLYSHFAAADDSNLNDHSRKQVAELLNWKNSLNQANIYPMIHTSATVGTFLKGFETHFDMVRIGGGLYGFWSSKEAALLNQKTVKLQPALSWKCNIAEIKNLPKGSHISYGCTYSLTRDSKIAILPIGYFDGIPRISSGKGKVLINGKKLPQIGRVTMNIIIIDITDLETVKIGDVATIIGEDNGLKITADDWGDWSQSFNYEITTRINSSLAKDIVD